MAQDSSLPSLRLRFLTTWRVISVAIVHILLTPAVIAYLLKRRLNPVVLAYVNVNVPNGLDPAQSKYQIYKSIEQRAPEISTLYPKSVLVSAATPLEERVRVARDFLENISHGYPIVAKPDKGTRSIGAYQVSGKEGLRYLLERIKNDYLIEEYCDDPLEAGLYFIRSPNHDHPSQYAVVLKRDSYIAVRSPHSELLPLLKHFLCEDVTKHLTPVLQAKIQEIANALPFDMGRIDVKVHSFKMLFSYPHNMRILEINTGVDAADLHASDLRYPFLQRLRMTWHKWEYALQLGEAYYKASRNHISSFSLLVRYARYGALLRSISANLRS